mmetsp:Transcript_744/g.917  ORF Transcript_744/g.917 Transcript_744/m.917 type:complete len:268 (+) Transcript_744:250-1053(+)
MVFSTTLHHAVHFGCHILDRNRDVISPQAVKDAAGIVILEHIKGAFVFSGHIASGFLSKRLGANLWSYPSAVFLCGAGIGFQAGAQKSDVIIILNDPEQVHVFERSGQLSIGSQYAISVGTVGFDVQADVRGSRGGITGCISVSNAMGAFAGLSLDGSIVMTNYFANRFFYGKGHHIKKILNNDVKVPGRRVNDCTNLNNYLLAFGHDDLPEKSHKIKPITDVEEEEVDAYAKEVSKTYGDQVPDQDFFRTQDELIPMDSSDGKIPK